MILNCLINARHVRYKHLQIWKHNEYSLERLPIWIVYKYTQTNSTEKYIYKNIVKHIQKPNLHIHVIAIFSLHNIASHCTFEWYEYKTKYVCMTTAKQKKKESTILKLIKTLSY